MHGTKYPGGLGWLKVNTAGTLRYSITSVLHNEVKIWILHNNLGRESLVCVKMKLAHRYSLLLK
jgi:hypothetical protein